MTSGSRDVRSTDSATGQVFSPITSVDASDRLRRRRLAAVITGCVVFAIGVAALASGLVVRSWVAGAAGVAIAILGFAYGLFFWRTSWAALSVVVDSIGIVVQFENGRKVHLSWQDPGLDLRLVKLSDPAPARFGQAPRPDRFVLFSAFRFRVWGLPQLRIRIPENCFTTILATARSAGAVLARYDSSTSGGRYPGTGFVIMSSQTSV